MNSKEFIKEFNKRIDWNIELIKEMGGTIQKDNTYKWDFEDCLSTEKIDPSDIEPNSVEIFEEIDGEDYIEMQAFSFKECHIMYYFLYKDETEEVYKKKKVNYLLKRIEKAVKENSKKMDELKKDINDLQVLMGMVGKISLVNNSKN